MNVVGLGGGIGAARFWEVLVPAVGMAEVTLIVNVADDMWIYGLRVCPDLDTTLYALSGRRDGERGWGVKGESWHCMETMRDLGHDVWFNLGDHDLATHLLRTSLLHQELGLAAVTARLVAAMDVGVTVLPVTEHEVTTHVETACGRRLHYEEFLVRHGAEPVVRCVEHVGLRNATAAPGVLDAVRAADVVIIAPSNPVASVLPILDVSGVRDAIRGSGASVVAVSPIVSGAAIADPAEARRARSRQRLMASLGHPATASGVAHLYRELVDRFVLDTADEDERSAVEGLGLEAVVAPTLLHLGAPPEPLLDAVLNGARPSTVAAPLPDAAAM